MTRIVTRIAVAVATRERPRMLSDLLQSCMALDVPQGSELVFIVVENDAELTIADLVEDFSNRSGWPGIAVHEPNIGIGYARNRALQAARDAGADWIAFVDDDELVRYDWLRNLWAGAKDLGAQMAGGPLRPVAPRGGCSDSEADVLAYLVRAAEMSDARKMRAQMQGRRFDLATNNWIAELAALDAADLSFDLSFNLSGGEDTDLSRRAHRAGLKLGWVPNAIVSEEVPPERLTSAYVYSRARHQAITKQELKVAEAPKRAAVYTAVTVVSKGLSGLMRIVVSPLLGRYHYFRGLRSLGTAAGFLAAFTGQKQAQYSEVTGE